MSQADCKCPKCHGYAKVKYKNTSDIIPGFPSKEFLSYTCQACGYHWTTETKDAKVSTPSLPVGSIPIEGAHE